MRALLAFALLLALTGCASPRAGLVWWNPTTWPSRAAPAAVDRAERKVDEAAAKVDFAAAKTVHAANVEVGKLLEVLLTLPESRQAFLAKRFAETAHSLLNQTSPLSVDETRDNRELVRDLLSENTKAREAAEKRQQIAEDSAATLGRDLAQARQELQRRDAALAAANSNLRQAYDRENALANQVRNFWFIAGVLVLLWLGGNLLGAAARFYPPLAGVSRVVNGLAAPALAFAEQRAHVGLEKVGHAVAAVKDKLPELAELASRDHRKAIEALELIFDSRTDTDHQRTIGAAAATAPRPPST